MQKEVGNWIKRGALGIPQIAVASSPLIAKLSGVTSIVWPPLGTLSDYVAPTATIMIALFSILPDVFVERRNAKKWVAFSLLGTVICFLLYAFLIGKYVVTVPTPADGPQTRSVGFIVEPAVRALYPNASFPTLLLHGGLDEDRIEMTWTPNSVLAARLCMLTFLAMTLALTNVTLGSAAYLSRNVSGEEVRAKE